MRRLILGTLALAATLLVPLAAHTPLAQGAPATGAAAQARVIVKYRADSPLLRRQALSVDGQRTLQARGLGQRIGVDLSAGLAISDRSHVVTARGIGSAALAARLSAEPDVEYAVVDGRKFAVAVPNDPFYATRAYNNAGAPTAGGPLVGQWYLKPPGAALTGANTAPSAMNAEQAWDTLIGSATIVVAVLDTGLRFDHTDLQGGNVLPGYDMVSEDSPGVFASANDGNGRDADASDPGDFLTNAESTDPASPLFQCPVQTTSSWHGTQTLGVIGARTDNSVGMASVGRHDRNVRVMPVRVLGKCGGFDSDILAAMRWAAGIAVAGVPANATPAKVINMSLGGTGACNQAYTDAVAAVAAQGSVVVASAGNSAGRAVNSPANCAGVISVSGLRHVGTKVGFSDLGPEITLSAPGGNCINLVAGSPCLYSILTTSNSGATTPVAGAGGAIYTDSFNFTVGTSFSAPLVAGTAALMLSARATLTPAQVRSILQQTVRPFPTTGGSAGTIACVAPGNVDQLECYCTTTTCGAGMLDARAAVLAASSSGVQAQVAVTTVAPIEDLPVMLVSTSAVGAGQSIASYAWVIVSVGTTGATITAGQGTPTVTVTPTAAGTFSISLTTTDNIGFVSTVQTSVTVAAAPVVVVPPASAPAGSSDGGGGGALGAGWLLLLLSAVLALAGVARAERSGRAVSAPARSSRRG